MYIVTGPINGNNRYGTIGDSDVVVPDAFFKAVLMQDKGTWHSIAFVMENRSYNENMQKCAMTVDELEELTGFDFFAALDDGIEEKTEGIKSFKVWKL